MRTRFQSLLLSSFATSAVALANPLPEPVDAILEDRCLDCHDATVRKGNLDLSALPFDLSTPAVAAAWEKVHDRVSEGEMPPKNKKPLTSAQKEALAGWLNQSLTADTLAKQAENGRALARRLNRDEYQNTLRDLLGIEADYRKQLPEDGASGGFDKVGSALSISAEHTAAYMSAARAALDEMETLSRRPPAVRKRFPQRWSPKFFGTDFHKNFGRIFGDLPDALVRFGPFVPSIRGERGSYTVAESGYYKVRVRSRAYQSDKPVTLRLRAGHASGNSLGEVREIGFYDVPPEGREVEVTAYAYAGETFHAVPFGITGPGPEGGLTSIPKDQSWRDYRGPGLAVEWVEVEGPLAPPKPPRGMDLLFGGYEVDTAGPKEAGQALHRFLEAAFRRPVREEEVARYVALQQKTAERSGFRQGMFTAAQAALCSPHFLFLDGPAGPLDDHALAARLSYFLTCSMPDAELTTLAAAGELRSPEVLRGQVERLLDSPKAASFVESFAGQWLDLRKIHATSPDPKLYPEADAFLEWSMVKETRHFFAEILRENLDVSNFVDSDFTFLNERLATHYGLPGVTGTELRRVTLPAESIRGGVLAQASVLKVTANGTTSSPVLRGVWVLERILGQHVPPPPAGVPSVEPDIRGAQTIREQLAKHTDSASCAACHEKMDPPGFALESFDVIGGHRERYRTSRQDQPEAIKVVAPMSYSPRINAPFVLTVGEGRPVDPSGTWRGGGDFSDFRSFRQQLAERPDIIVRCLTGKLLTYATGHGIDFCDRTEVERIVAALHARDDRGLRSLIHEVVQSRLFLNQ